MKRGSPAAARRITLLAALAGAVPGGCITIPRAIDTIPRGEWLLRSGDARHAAFAAEIAPERVRVAWNAGLGRGLPAMPIVHEDLLITVVSGGGLVAASAATGDRYWARRFNGSIAGQALRVDDRIFVATQHRSGNLYALDIRRGRRAWSRKLDARAAAEPAYADGVLYQPTDRGDVLALDARGGHVLWRSPIGGRTVFPALVVGPNLLLAARDTLLLLERQHGQVLRRMPVAVAPSAPLAVAGDTVVLVGGRGVVAAYAQYGAVPLWQHDLGDVSLSAPVIAPDGVYLLTRTARVVRADAAGVHTVARLEGAATESLTLTATGLLVGLLDGRLLLLRRDGTRVWEQQLDGSLRAPPAVRDSSIFVATLGGRLIKLSP